MLNLPTIFRYIALVPGIGTNFCLFINLWYMKLSLLLIEDRKPRLGRREMYKIVIYLSSSAFFLWNLCLSYVVVVNSGNDVSIGEISADWTVNFPSIICVTMANCLSSAIFYLLTCVIGTFHVRLRVLENEFLRQTCLASNRSSMTQLLSSYLGLCSLHPETVSFWSNLNICCQDTLVIQDDMINVV